MDNDKMLTRKAGRTRGNLLRLDQDLHRAKDSLSGATRNRIIGGVLLLIGLLSLIQFFVQGGRQFMVIAVAGLFIGGLVLIMAMVKIGQARRSVETITGGVATAQAKLDELETPPPVAEELLLPVAMPGEKERT